MALPASSFALLGTMRGVYMWFTDDYIERVSVQSCKRQAERALILTILGDIRGPQEPFCGAAPEVALLFLSGTQ